MSYTAHSRPTDWAVAVVGTGAAYVTDPTDQFQGLFCGRPANATRLRLPSDWTGVITEYVEIQFTRATAIAPGLVGLIGWDLIGLASAAGLKVTFMGKRVGDAGFTYDLGGNTALVRTRTRWDSSTIALGMCDSGVDPIIGYAMRIYNDQDGVANLAANGYIDQGNAWCSPGMEIDIEENWEFQYPQGDVPVSPDGQPWPSPFPPGRVLPVERQLIDVDDAFVGSTVPTYQQLARLLGNGKVSIQIPRWRDGSGALDVDLMHETAIFGTTKFGKIPHNGGDFYSATWTVTEVPALLAE